MQPVKLQGEQLELLEHPDSEEVEAEEQPVAEAEAEEQPTAETEE